MDEAGSVSSNFAKGERLSVEEGESGVGGTGRNWLPHVCMDVNGISLRLRIACGCEWDITAIQDCVRPPIGGSKHCSPSCLGFE